MSEFILKIDAEDLARVVPFASMNDIRYYLQGVCVEPHEEGAILVATDGHTLAALHSPNSFTAETVILGLDRRFSAEIRKAGLKRNVNAFVQLKDAGSYPEIVKTASYEITYVSPRRPALVDGKFPEWRKIMPKDDELADGLAGCFNASYLEKAAEAASLANGPTSRYNGIKVQHNKKDPKTSPLVVRTSENKSLVILVMPQRDDFISALPEWTRVKVAPEKPEPIVTAEPVEAAAA